MSINRYNQGFGGFGPLEQCKDGKLVLAKDFDEAIAERDERVDYWFGKAMLELNRVSDEHVDHTRTKAY